MRINKRGDQEKVQSKYRQILINDMIENDQRDLKFIVSKVEGQLHKLID